MANARIAKFVTEVAPPQYIKVMRNRATKMLDTIKEDDRSDHIVAAQTSTSISTNTSSCSPAVAVASKSKSSAYFLAGIHQQSLFNL
ncbi:hypothetical protein LINGRAPRIM_LOCUS1193 [Linum grandiflorum]